MFVLLRHPHDEDPEATYILDPHITSRGINSIKKRLDMLIDEYGIPSIIYTSPLTRCRESSYYIKNCIESMYGIRVKVIVDPSISRYFTSKEKINPDVRQKTLLLKTPVREDWRQFKRRIRNFKNNHRHELQNTKTLVWCITHYLVIREYSKIMGFTIPKKMPYMWHIGLY